MARRWRAWHAQAEATGDEVLLDEEETHHVLRVLRLHTGEPLSVFDGKGREWAGTIVRAGSGEVVVRLEDEMTDAVEPALPVMLVQGLSRPERLEWVLEKATEVGVRAIALAACARSDGPVPSPARLDRWRRVLLESCKQSGRRRIPDLFGPLPLGDAAALGTGTRIVLVPGAHPLTEALPGRPEAVALAVGPEGGFGDEEVDALKVAGWSAASLGPRTLRTETAGPVAAALLLHRWGDLGRGKAD
jgi:16S rRNA (uracil1498-N3)-methyltransferase